MLLLGVVLMATHLGEFWPYSIYPMFSQAGRPWSRAIVRDVTGLPVSSRWKQATVQTLPGNPLALSPLGIPQNDVAKFVKLTKRWTPARVRGLRKLFAEHLEGREFLVYSVQGNVDELGAVTDAAVPLVWLSGDGRSEVNPDVARADTEVALGRP